MNRFQPLPNHSSKSAIFEGPLCVRVSSNWEPRYAATAKFQLRINEPNGGRLLETYDLSRVSDLDHITQMEDSDNNDFFVLSITLQNPRQTLLFGVQTFTELHLWVTSLKQAAAKTPTRPKPTKEKEEHSKHEKLEKGEKHEKEKKEKSKSPFFKKTSSPVPELAIHDDNDVPLPRGKSKDFTPKKSPRKSNDSPRTLEGLIGNASDPSVKLALHALYDSITTLQKELKEANLKIESQEASIISLQEYIKELKRQERLRKTLSMELPAARPARKHRGNAVPARKQEESPQKSANRLSASERHGRTRGESDLATKAKRLSISEPISRSPMKEVSPRGPIQPPYNPFQTSDLPPAQPAQPAQPSQQLHPTPLIAPPQPPSPNPWDPLAPRADPNESSPLKNPINHVCVGPINPLNPFPFELNSGSLSSPIARTHTIRNPFGGTPTTSPDSTPPRNEPTLIQLQAPGTNPVGLATSRRPITT